MLVTIICDASHCPETGVAGYGFWIASGRGKRGGKGVMRHSCATNTVAEMQAMANALYVAVRLELVQAGDTVLVQTDCLGAIDGLIGMRKKMLDQEHDVVTAFFRIKSEARITIDFRHVKGHTKEPGARFAANRACDKDAREQMRKARARFLINKLNQEPIDGTESQRASPVGD